MELFAKLFSSLLVFVYHCFGRPDKSGPFSRESLPYLNIGDAILRSK
jgi:hypothetical protein